MCITEPLFPLVPLVQFHLNHHYQIRRPPVPPIPPLERIVPLLTNCSCCNQYYTTITSTSTAVSTKGRSDTTWSFHLVNHFVLDYLMLERFLLLMCPPNFQMSLNYLIAALLIHSEPACPSLWIIQLLSIVSVP